MTDEDVRDELVSSLKDNDAKMEHLATNEAPEILSQDAEKDFETKSNFKSEVKHIDSNLSRNCETEQIIMESVLKGVDSPYKDKLVESKGKQTN